MRTRLLIIALALLAVVSTALATVIGLRSVDSTSGSSEGSGRALIGGAFTAVDQTGRQVSEKDYLGRWTIFYFGYTFCPDVCPLGLQVITEALEQLPGPVRQNIIPIFVTVDPERDTVPVMASYVSNFVPGMVGLTGTVEQMEALKRAWRVYARKAEGGTATDYLVDHSAFTYLMDPKGNYVTHFGHDVTADQLAARLKSLVGPIS